MGLDGETLVLPLLLLYSLSEPVEVSGFCVVAFQCSVTFLLLLFCLYYFSVPAIALLLCSLQTSLFLSEIKDS